MDGSMDSFYIDRWIVRPPSRYTLYLKIYLHTDTHTHPHPHPHPQYTGHDCLRALIALYPPAMQLADDIDPVLDLDKVRAA